MESVNFAWLFADLVMIINLFLILLVVIFERRNPLATLSWILLLVFIPVAGFILYIFLGQNLRRKKLFYLKEEEEQELLPLLARQDTSLHENSLPFPDSRVRGYQDLIHLHLTSNYSLLSLDNQIEIFQEGQLLFDDILSSLRNARHYIHMEYFIIRDDALGRLIMKVLAEKASQGIEVKLLYDGMGCIRLRPGFFKKLHQAGGETAVFFPPFLPYINLRINFRNHRKICIIDGQEAYVGGFNIGDEYRDLSSRFGHWRDTHLKITGGAIDSLEMRFLLDWRFAAHDPLTDAEQYFPERISTGNSAVQIVSSGPDLAYPSIKNGILKLINKARHSIYIETPYLIPDDSLLDALKIAALSGIDVRIIIPDKPDHFYVHWASLSYVGELLAAGVRCYRYTRGFIHSKMVCIDGFASSVGTANMDIRSFELNFEVNAFIYDENVSRQLQDEFLAALQDCREISPQQYAARPLWDRFREGVFRLLSPIF